MEQKLIQVAPGKVKILKNVRTEVDKTGLIELSKSIKENGLLQPITVRKGKSKTYELITGQRRLLASRMAKIGKIPAIEVTMEDNQIAVMQTIENVDREDLTEIQLAYAFVRMADEDLLTLKEISIKMGVSIKRTKEMLSIKNLIPAIDKLLKTGKMELDAALTFGKFSKDIQKLAIEENEWITQRDPKRIEEFIIENFSGNLSYPGFDMQDPNLNPKFGSCSSCQFNTSNNKELFDTGKSLCTNLPCYNLKRKVRIERIVKIFNDKKEKFYLIGEGSIDKYNQMEVLERNEYRLWNAKLDSKLPSYSAIVVNGNSFGSVHPIVLTSDLKKIEKKEREKIIKSGDAKAIAEATSNTRSVPPDTKHYNTLDQYERERHATVMNGWNKLVLESKKFGLNDKNVILLFEMIYSNLDYRVHERICKMLGVEMHNMTSKVFHKTIPDFTTLTKVIVQCMSDYSIPERNDDDESLEILCNFVQLNFDKTELMTIAEKAKATEKEKSKLLLEKFQERWKRVPLPQKQLKDNSYAGNHYYK